MKIKVIVCYYMYRYRFVCDYIEHITYVYFKYRLTVISFNFGLSTWLRVFYLTIELAIEHGHMHVFSIDYTPMIN